MNRVNPIYIPRNHKVEEVLVSAAENQTLEPFEALIEVLERPFDEKEGLEDYALPAPASFGPYSTFCGNLIGGRIERLAPQCATAAFPFR